ncbi:MAG: hypothetical protein AAGB97_09655 [Dehalococcoidia bacterium]|nr:hypothetical protein [Chloroflexota bacterium]
MGLDEKAAGKAGKEVLREILAIEEARIIGLLSREKRLLYQNRFKISDRTDVPHAISAFLENCSYIVTYDTHFQEISHLIKVATPEEFTNQEH